jgi:hypothetical protein
VPSNRFDFGTRSVVENETINLHEPFAIASCTLAQINEFAHGRRPDGRKRHNIGS